jgi:tRNA A-37 threonylcarbamoyl transferase component Bud32
MEEGQVIAKAIRLSRPLGEGGMGSVWLADHLTLETQVVVKFMHQALGEDAASRERFSREAVAASQVKSPHVVQTFDHGVTPEGVAFIVMERLDGEDLAHRIQKGPLSPKEVALILVQVSRALGRAHAVGIVHRDIKPDNIFLCDVGSDEPFVKLLDFGIAKTALNPKLDNNTRTGAMMGTPYYMSPEQFAGTKGIDFRTDLWSLGIVGFEALTGRRPFDADTIGGLAIAVHAGELPLPSQVRPEYQPFDAWFAKACCRQVAGRFQSAKEFGDSFAAIVWEMGAGVGGRPLTSTDPGAVQAITNPAGQTNPGGVAGLNFGTNPGTNPGVGTGPYGANPGVVPGGTQALLLSTGSSAAVESDPMPGAAPKRPSRVSLYVALGVAGVVGLVAAAALTRHGSASPAVASPVGDVNANAAPPPAAPPAPPIATVVQPAQLVQLPTVDPVVAPPEAPAAPAAVSHGPSKPPSAGQAHGPAAAPHPAAPAVASPSPSPPTPAPKAAPNCNPPYTVDGAGVKHPKAECL